MKNDDSPVASRICRLCGHYIRVGVISVDSAHRQCAVEEIKTKGWEG